MRFWLHIALITVIVGVVVGRPLEADGRVVGSAVIDLALTEDGQLIGRCQDSLGQNVQGAPVDLSEKGTLIARVRSRQDGTFVFADATAGVYELSSTNWQRPVRIWAAEAAPPAAQEPIVILLDEAAPRSPEQSGWNEFALDRQPEERGDSAQTTTDLALWTEPAPSVSQEARDTAVQDAEHRSPFPPDSFDGTLAQADDQEFYPFDSPMEQPQPVPDIVDAPGPGAAQPISPPLRYPAGPTIGEVFTITTVITSVVIGAVAVDEVSDLRDRIKRASSP